MIFIREFVAKINRKDHQDLRKVRKGFEFIKECKVHKALGLIVLINYQQLSC